MKAIIEHVALVTRLLGAPVSEAALSAEVVRDKKLNVNYHSLTEVLRSHGFENTLSKRSLEDIPSLAVPVLAILHNEEAAVITKIEGAGKDRKYHIRQVDGLEQELDHAQLSVLYLGYCWFIKPKMVSDNRSELPNQAYDTLWVLSIGVVLAILFEFAAKMIRGHLTDIAGKKADLIISSALFRRVMALRLADRPASSGSYANNLREFESVRDFMTSASLLTLVDLPFLLLFITVIGIVGGKLALVPLIIIPIVVIVGLLVQRPLSRYINESMKESSQRSGLAVEAIEGIETLKTNNATSWAQQRWDEYTAKTSASSIKVKDTSNLMVNFAVAMQQLNTVFLVLVGTYLIHAENTAERITMGALIASVILSGRALAPLAQIAGLATRFQQAKLALQGVNDIVSRPIERSPERKYITLDNVQGAITFENISFKYQQDSSSAVSDLRITIRPGEKVGILGRIGSGKSTMLKLASGLYDTEKGNVTLDGVDMRQLDPNFLRNQVVLLSQAPRLFLGTLRENMDLARTDGYSTDQDLLVALKRFGLDKIIRNHPRGLDMPLGEDGLGLSGGQKQIIALARMTLRDPRVVLLDEPTTSLDQATERIALNAIAQWGRDRTMLLVTHRPQVLQIVNRIIVMDNGKVVMDGPRDLVLQNLMQSEQQNRAKQQANHPAVQQNTQAQPAKAASANS